MVKHPRRYDAVEGLGPERYVLDVRDACVDPALPGEFHLARRDVDCPDLCPELAPDPLGQLARPTAHVENAARPRLRHGLENHLGRIGTLGVLVGGAAAEQAALARILTPY